MRFLKNHRWPFNSGHLQATILYNPMISYRPSFQNHLPRRIITGRGQSLLVGEVCIEQGWRKVFVVSDQGVANAGLLSPLLENLRQHDLLSGYSTAVPAEPPLDSVDALAQEISRSGAETIVALGGGSVMDAAKVASLSVRHSKPAREFVGIGKAGGRGLPTILIPTTAGTGSEATFVGIFTDPVTTNKVGVVDPCILADIAIVDPALTDHLPPLITAASGMDAIVHTIEAYIAKVTTPIARGLAIEAARNLGDAFEKVVRDPADPHARDGMAIGSHLAGMAFANSSCCAVHALALPLGGRFHIAHGVITGCFAGEMMRHNQPACVDDFKDLIDAFGWKNMQSIQFGDRLDQLAVSSGLRSHLHKTSVPAQTFESLAKDAVAIRRLMDPNPREVTEADAVRIFKTVLGG
jgi:alcohol dehydrogenase class IV